MTFPSPDIVPGEGDIRQSGRQINESRDAARALDRQRRQFIEMIAERRRAFTMGGYDFHPFKLYLAQLAFSDDTNPVADQTTWWRTFLVRAGEIGGIALEGAGCDEYDVDPFSDYIPLETENDDGGEPLVPITVPIVGEYFFWIELTLAGPALRSGPDPTTATVDAQKNAIKNPWYNYPAPDGLHLMIAEVDTTGTPNNAGPASIRQYMTADINNGLQLVGCDQTGAAANIVLPNAYLANPPN